MINEHEGAGFGFHELRGAAHDERKGLIEIDACVDPLRNPHENVEFALCLRIQENISS